MPKLTEIIEYEVTEEVAAGDPVLSAGDTVPVLVVNVDGEGWVIGHAFLSDGSTRRVIIPPDEPAEEETPANTPVTQPEATVPAADATATVPSATPAADPVNSSPAPALSDDPEYDDFQTWKREREASQGSTPAADASVTDTAPAPGPVDSPADDIVAGSPTQNGV